MSTKFESITGWVKSIIRKGNETKLDVTKKDKSVVKIPLTILALIIVFAPYLSVIAFAIALFTEHKFQLIKNNGENVEFQKMFD